MANRIRADKPKMLKIPNWMILLVLVWTESCIQQSNAQNTSTVSQYEGVDITLSCSLTGSFTFPQWRGPPTLAKYTNQDDSSGLINSVATAAGRLEYASNNKDLILSKAVIADSGDFQCSYTGLGDHTITLTVNPATTTQDDDNGLSTGAIVGIVSGSVVSVIIIVVVILAIMGKLPGKGDKDDTSRGVESTRSSPEKAENKLLNKEKQISATGKADGGNKGKQFGDTQIHNDKSQKVHPENEEKPFRPQPLPPPGAKLNHSLAEDNHGTGAGDSFSLTKLPPIQNTPRTDKPN